MHGKEHFIFGTTTAAMTAVLLYNTQSIYFSHPLLFTITASIGSLMPDLDSPESTISTKFEVTSQLICSLCKHRTYMHDIFLWSVITIICTYFFPLSLGFFFGYIGHLLLDSMTVQGIPWLYFINKKNIKRGKKCFLNGTFHLTPKFLRFKSNSFMAKITTYTLITAAYTFITHNMLDLLLHNLELIFT